MKRALIAVLFLLAGCGAEAIPPSPFEDCVALARGSSELPSIDLPCFEGGQTIQLGQLKGPLVLNIWASWCEPCRKELPVFQRLADRGGVGVIGVDSEDTREKGSTLAEDFGITFPALFDASGQLRKALGEIALPVTLFVDGNGKVTRYVGPALTDDKLATLLRERLGSS